MRTLLSIACLVLVAALAPAATAGNDGGEVVAWNETLLAVAEAEDGFLTLKGLRTAALMHLAMHDALNTADARYRSYATAESSADGDGLATAIFAAFTVCTSQYPDQETRFAALRDQGLERAGGSSGMPAARKLGEEIARRVLATRDGDGWDSEAEYRWHPMAPGVYAEFNEHSGTPEGFVFGAGWARAKGFALEKPDQFVSPPPPAIDSTQYAKAFDEVKSAGRFQSMDRTADQTHLALWWKDFVENSHNRLARDLVVQQDLDAIASARLFALLNMSIFDAYVASFANKFRYNHWRPYTAIRWAANDGNDATVADPTWNNTHRHTYAFPSYPSAHGTACAAAMTAMSDTFGDGFAFTMQTPAVDIAGPFSEKLAMQPATRRFGSFYDAARECAASRVYLGIHFRYDSDAGFDLGRQVGDNVVGRLLRAH